MLFKTYWDDLPKDEREALATKLTTSVEYLSQLATGFRKAGPKFLLGIEGATDGAVRPHELRPPERFKKAA